MGLLARRTPVVRFGKIVQPQGSSSLRGKKHKPVFTGGRVDSVKEIDKLISKLHISDSQGNGGKGEGIYLRGNGGKGEGIYLRGDGQSGEGVYLHGGPKGERPRRRRYTGYGIPTTEKKKKKRLNISLSSKKAIQNGKGLMEI